MGGERLANSLACRVRVQHHAKRRVGKPRRHRERVVELRPVRADSTNRPAGGQNTYSDSVCRRTAYRISDPHTHSGRKKKHDGSLVGGFGDSTIQIKIHANAPDVTLPPGATIDAKPRDQPAVRA